LPDGVSLSTEGAPGSRFAVSPDGAHLAFVGINGGRPMLYLQSVNETTAHAIEGTEHAEAPFWSPNSRSLGFGRDARMMKVDVSGNGRVEEIGPMTGTASWTVGPSGEDLILTTFDRPASDGPPSRGIRAVPLPGSRTAAANLFVVPEGAADLFSQPAPLYDGRHYVFAHGDRSSPALYVGTFGSGEQRQLVALDPDTEQLNFAYASGYLVGARNQAVTARAFDRSTLTASTDIVDIAGPVLTVPRAGAAFSVSQNGVLVYESPARKDLLRLSVYHRTGDLLRTLADDAPYSNVELSPSGTKLAVSVTDPGALTRDIWLVDLQRGSRSRFTSDRSDERSAVWGIDGTSLIYNSKGLDFYERPLDSGAETVFLKDGLSKDPRGWSIETDSFAYRVSGASTRNDIWIRPLDPAKQPYAFLATPADENYATFAPGGRWMAYVSDETGRPEIYATSFPSAKGKWPISTGGGSFPRWRRDGKEIVYLAPDGTLMAVPVLGVDPMLLVGKPAVLFRTNAAPGPGSVFDMSADGEQFIVITVAPPAPPALHVLFNWPELVKNAPRN